MPTEWTPPWAAGGAPWAIVTAWNPGGQRHPDAVNRRAACQLRRAWTGEAVPVVNGAAPWAEEALLLPGARLRDAAALGRQFGQAAVLWGAGGRVAVVWLGPVVVERCWAMPVGPYTGSP
ncbi:MULTISPECIES: DUF3293 domain-containing protein [Deinococcus]|uniref:DUF3293 domain-containing protein n=1 Tax=Deinococcus rufus TaxID=2136097 RepID=A0ABV7ZF71_9DEIO|nr:DUF3293 domain-containing protein [Deinococcus sp. AB2017081]WQE96916.1 DUF3293 domain-containing protein [Deinococcus sp. AB2017081]